MSAQALECPKELPATSFQLANAPPGWRFFAELPLYLHAAEPMSGPPEQLGHLIEDSVKKNKDQWTYTYTLDGPFPNGKWLLCSYGAHSEMTLSKRISDETQMCKISYRKGSKAEQREINIHCE
ncbi:hypothetical protein GTP77_09765 [Massilia sp. FT127W]|uniref:Uncharacterized protein n=2 Tax=Pseudoduganella aquatica TaxID=2660641 RepID=A0A7X4KKZ8_9BURK|nr:hypothetical protein [Pseudoduganella aquatica]